MRLFRALSTVVALTLVFSLAVSDGFSALAQSVGEAEDQAERAARQADQASGLVESAVANRSAVELDLLNAITQINELSAELSRLSVDLDALSEQLGFADLELAGIEADIELHAVDAYMSALSGQTIAVVNSDNVEEALVTGLVVGDIINAGQRDIDGLVVKKRDLQGLYDKFLSQQEQVAAKQAEFDAAKEHLADLYEQADADVAAAARAADEADTAYRAALSDVDAARARAAEKDRQDSSTTTSTTEPPGTFASTTTTTPRVTTSTTGGGEYPWTPPPSVEQWRALVSAHFPANRVDEALHIMWCESRGDPNALNPFSGAAGLFQFIPSTWATASPKAGYEGASPFEPEANTATAAWLAQQYANAGQYYWQAWNCKRVLP